MAQLVLTSDTLAGTPATGTLEYNGQFFGTDSAASRAQMQRITLATTVASTSGTSIDFTSIPAWVKRITVMFSGVSLNSTSSVLIQLGYSGGVENTGYVSTCVLSRDGTTPTGLTSTAGFVIVTAIAANLLLGNAVLTLVSGNTWVFSSAYAMSGSTHAGTAGGNKTTTGTLDRVRITTVSGTDTFDAGSVNILYEG